MDSTIGLITKLDPQKIFFTKRDSGFLDVEYDGELHQAVAVNRLFPYFDEGRYLSIKEGEKELGILEDLTSLSGPQQELLQEYLRFRYYSPKVLKIHKIEEKMGYLYLDVSTSAGEKMLCVGDLATNLRYINEKRIHIVDVEGNRYYIEDIHQIDSKSRKRLEAYV